MPNHVTDSDRIQLTTRSLFFWTSIAAVCLLPAVYQNPVTIIVAFCVVMVLLVASKRVRYADAWPIGLLGLFFMGCLMLPTVNSPHPAGKRTICSNNMRQISLALLNYESNHGHFPPAYTVDENGNRLHSWRTLILPYMEYDHLYNQIVFELPWDHPANAAVASVMPDIYRCPSEQRRKRIDFTTPYIGIIGDGLIWKNDGEETRLLDVSDGISNTIMLVEAHQHRVHWMSPNDLQYERLIQLLKNSDFEFTKGTHTGGCNIARGDGSVSFLRNSTPPDILISALLINDGNAEEF